LQFSLQVASPENFGCTLVFGKEEEEEEYYSLTL
jgi:hypothetical protein